MTNEEAQPYNFACGYKSYFDTYLTQYKNAENLKFLEIGSMAGESASWFMSNILTHPTSILTCLDSWENPIPKSREVEFDKVFNEHSPRIVKVKKDSFYWLIENQKAQYDFIYIDGDHKCSGATLDMFGSFPMLKAGGLMAIDDYNIKNWRGFPGVEPAVDLFLDLMSDKIKVLHKHNQVWIQKL
jgi:hypothetical protein